MMDMEIDKQTRSRVWWQGAISSAIKGIPQGIMLGLLGAGVLFGGIFLIQAFGAAPLAFEIAKDFGSFLFSNAAVAEMAAGSMPAFGLAAINVIPVVALNAVLTIVGNFLTGGDMAVNKHQQEVDHEHNNLRIRAIEGREQQCEKAIHMLADHGEKLENKFDAHTADVAAQKHTPQHVQKILEEGPRIKVDKEAAKDQSASHAADIVSNRLEDAERAIS